MNIISRLKTLGRITAAALMLGGVALGTGCIQADPPALKLSEQTFRVGADGGDLDLRVISNTDWEAVDYPDWITLSTAKGQGSMNITVEVAPYEDLVSEGRQAAVTFVTRNRGSETMATLVVNQSKHASELMVTPPDYTVGSSGGNVFFVVTSNTRWKVIGADQYDWFTMKIEGVDTNEGQGTQIVTLAVAPHDVHSQDREAHLIIVNEASNGLIPETFTLVQSGLPDPEFLLGQNRIHFPADVTSDPGILPYRVPLITNINLPDDPTPVVQVSAVWCQAEVVKDPSGIWYVEISPEDNITFDARSCIVTVTIPHIDEVGTALMQQIEVTQDGSETPRFEIISSVVNIAAASDAGLATDPNVVKTVGYIINDTAGEVKVDSWPDWLTQTAGGTADGKPVVDNGTITFTALPNPGANMRSGDIVMSASGGDVTIIRTLTVIQNGIGEFTITVTPGAVNLPAGGTAEELTATVYVRSSNPEMQAPTAVQIDGSWLTINSVTDMGLATGKGYAVEFTATANQQHSSRIGTLDIFASAGDQTAIGVVNVSQFGIGAPQITVMPTFVTLGKDAGSTADLAILNAEQADLSLVIQPEGWVTLPASPLADKTNIHLEAAENNPGAQARTATLFIIAQQGGETQVVQVGISQAGNNGAAIDLAKNIYEIDATAQMFDIPAKALNGSTVTLVGWDPEAVFADTAPALTPDGTALESIHVTIAENVSSEPRTAEIVLSAENGDEHQFYTIVILQKGNVPIDAELVTPYLNAQWQVGDVDEKMMIIDLPEGTTTADITFVSPAGWITLAAIDPIVVSGTSATLAFTVTEANPKTTDREAAGIITVTRGSEHRDLAVTIVQEGAPAPQVMTAASEVVFGANDAAGTSQTVVFHNVNGADLAYTVHPEDQAFVTGNVDAATHTLTLELASGPNTTMNEINKIVNVHAEANGVMSTIPITVRQLSNGAPELVLGANSMIFGASAQVGQKFNWGNPNLANVSLISVPSWIIAGTLVQGTAGDGDGAGSIAFDVAANTTTEDRTGDIVLLAQQSGKSVFYHIGVVQSAPSGSQSVFVAPVGVYANYEAYAVFDQLIAVAGMAAGTEATITSLNGWITPSVTALMGNGSTQTFQIGLTENDTDRARTGTILIEVTTGDVVERLTVSVLQMAAPSAGFGLIDATLVEYSNSTPLANTDTQATIAFADDLGNATSAPDLVIDDISYAPAADQWLSGATITLSGASPTRQFDITGIPTNASTAPRSAVITIKVTAQGYEDQYIRYTLTQDGIPTIDAVYQSSYVAEVGDTTLNIAPVDSGNIGTITIPSSVVFPMWVTGETVNGDQLLLDVAPNDAPGATPRWGDVSFTLTKPGYADQTVEVFIFQMPETTTNLLTIDSTPTLGWQQGSTGDIGFTDKPGSTTVSIYTFDGSFFSSIGTPTATPDPNDAGTIAVTAGSRNATGNTEQGVILLKAENGGVVEWYEVDVQQISLTSAEIIAATEFQERDFGAFNTSWVDVNGGNGTASVTLSANSLVFGMNMPLGMTVTPASSFSGFTAAVTNFSSTTSVFDGNWSWNGSNEWSIYRRAGNGGQTQSFDVTITVGNVNAVIILTLTIQ